MPDLNIQTLKIRTDRLAIRPLESADAEDMFHYRYDDEIKKYQSFHPENIEKVSSFIKENTLHFNVQDNWYQLGIFKADKLIGDIGIHFIGPQNMQCEIGYTIAVQHQRNGYGKESVCGVVSYLFNELKKHRIIASLDPENIGSIRLLESTGFRKEGLMKQSIWVDGKWEDDLIYAVLNEEWGKK